MDGWLIIGTKIDEKKFDRELEKLENKSKNKKIEIDLTVKQLSKAKQDLDDMQKKAEGLFQEYQKANEEIKKQEDLISKISTKTDTGFTIQQGMMSQYNKATLAVSDLKAKQRELEAEYSKMTPKLEKQEETVERINAKYKRQKNQLKEIGKQINDVKEKQERLKLSGIEKSINSVNSSLSGVVKKVAKWGLAVFGIRSAYNFVRQSISTLAGENEQLASDVEYIRYALASTLQPVIERLIQLVYKLLQYVNYLAQAWFGVNIFANANAKAMNKAVGSAKQLNKQLAGFDEMNVLSDTGSGAGSAGAMPSVDLTQMQGDVPEWLKWIADNKDILIGAIEVLIIGIVGLKYGLAGIMALGIGMAIAGIIALIQDVIKFIQDPSWEGFANILRDLAIVLAGVAVAMIAFNATNPIGWIMLAISAVALLVSVIIKNWGKIKQFLKDAVDWIKNTFNTVVSFFANLIQKIVGLFKTIGTKVADVIGGAFKAVINGVLKAIENILNFPIRQVNKLLDVINAVPGINISKLSTFSLPRLAKGGIVNMPGRGVPIGGAIAGEAGREAVLPLQDSQVLDEIAEAIGRRIALNPTIPIYIGSRLVAREIRKIDADEEFAYNK